MGGGCSQLTSALPSWCKLVRNVQLGSFHIEEDVKDDHEDDGDDDGEVRDVGPEDGGEEALVLELLEGGSDEVGAKEEHAAHEEDIGDVTAACARSCVSVQCQV